MALHECRTYYHLVYDDFLRARTCTESAEIYRLIVIKSLVQLGLRNLRGF